MRLFKAAIAAALLFIYGAAPVHAQTALVVLNCGAPPATLAAGQIYPQMQDLTGHLCTNSAGGSSIVTQPTASLLNVTAAQGTPPWRVNAQANDFATTSIVDIYNGSIASWDSLANPVGTFTVLNGLASIEQAALLPIKMPINITEHDCSVTLTTGATAQNAFAATATIHGYRIMNIDTTHLEDVWFSTTTTAAANTVASYRLAASPGANTSVQSASYTSPAGEAINTALSVIAATTGHLISCTYW